MHYVLGTDEAGYGPTLGPLLVGSSLWQLPDELPATLLATKLAQHVVMSREALTEAKQRGGTVAPLLLADSKVVYSPARGLVDLELAILALAALQHPVPQTWHALWSTFAPQALPPADLPWHQALELALPIASALPAIERTASELRLTFRETGIRLFTPRARAVFPGEFNDLVTRYGNKASLLSTVTLELARSWLDEVPPAPATIFCDKHGGRSSYAALLQQLFDVGLVRTLHEGRAESRYQITYRDQPIELVFLAKGESQLPTAVASMLAKYLREVAMIPLNRYWQALVPGLRETAGYPEDAKRFLAAIEPERKKLRLADHGFIRSR
ncbi:hypothetical protein Psta_0930 [Pirellula staleyi DSM 6068]|uniref:Uncharacterized protein n=1 Tax=Pirellula staleyi (strain ATCC 27377 / DSM 6068 / ICPB 4128) TaxID=530564 RepID=D2R7B9_PIRSD|nr:hypothetical protein [Pirellula staleyi]ADB15615.1 hypothetical protein Psta_0930 [Pirellula staleyi DSM 6068]